MQWEMARAASERHALGAASCCCRFTPRACTPLLQCPFSIKQRGRQAGGRINNVLRGQLQGKGPRAKSSFLGEDSLALAGGSMQAREAGEERKGRGGKRERGVGGERRRGGRCVLGL
jgi:hypothetical protein